MNFLPTPNSTTLVTARCIVLGLCAWAGGLGWLVGADIAAPLSWNAPLFSSNVTSGAVTLADGATITGKSITAVNYAASILCNGSSTISTVRIQSREGVRIAGENSLVTIDRTFMDIAGVGADHADGIQAYSPGGHGSFTITNSTIKMGTTAVNCGVFVADNYIGTFTFDNVVFWGGLFGLRIHPDVGGDQYVSLKDVYFVGPFAYGEFNFGNVAGHVVRFTKWENVRHATIVGGVLVPGALIPCPGTVEPGTPANHVPVAITQSVSTTTNIAKAITLAASDADGDALTYAIAAAPFHGTLSGSGANRTYTPASGFSGSDSFTFKASDGTATSAAATVAITVDAPAGAGSGGSSDSGSGHRCGLGSGLATMGGLLLGLLLTLRRRH